MPFLLSTSEQKKSNITFTKNRNLKKHQKVVGRNFLDTHGRKKYSKYLLENTFEARNIQITFLICSRRLFALFFSCAS